MRRSLGIVVVLLFAFASSALAQGGPPVPDGCTFERGVTTCTTVSEAYQPQGMVFAEGDVYCRFSDRSLFEVTIGSAAPILVLDETTTTYRGVSHVVKSESVTFLVWGLMGNAETKLVGRC